MEFSKAFLLAFEHAMKHEVGPWFDINDPDVISGKCDTKDQKRKVGYVNISGDRGGETKFGIAKNANPDLNIKTLTLAQAMEVYRERYWNVLSCESFPYPLSICIFDAAINHGTKPAAKMFQRAVKVNDDGDIGAITINASKTFNPFELCDIIIKSRESLFYSIVQRNPSQKKFLKGWLKRLEVLREFILSLQE